MVLRIPPASETDYPAPSRPSPLFDEATYGADKPLAKELSEPATQAAAAGVRTDRPPRKSGDLRPTLSETIDITAEAFEGTITDLSRPKLKAH